MGHAHICGWVGEGEILRFFALLRMTLVGWEAIVNPTSIAVELRLRWGTRSLLYLWDDPETVVCYFP